MDDHRRIATAEVFFRTDGCKMASGEGVAESEKLEEILRATQSTCAVMNVFKRKEEKILGLRVKTSLALLRAKPSVSNRETTIATRLMGQVKRPKRTIPPPPPLKIKLKNTCMRQ